LIQILGLFGAVPSFQANIPCPEEKEKRDAIVARLRERYPAERSSAKHLEYLLVRV
jgi:hypothetical protein